MKSILKTRFSLSILTVFFLGLIIGGFLTQIYSQQKLKALDKELRWTKIDLEFANNDQPRVLNTKETKYPIKDVSVYSDVFKEKKVEENELLFKGKTFKEYIITLDENNTFPTKVKIWDYKSSFEDLFNHSEFVEKLRIATKNEYRDSRDEAVYVSEKGFAWNKDWQIMRRMEQPTSNHAVFVEVLDSQPIVGQVSTNDSTKSLEAIVDSISFN